jgi:hypothetical protein
MSETYNLYCDESCHLENDGQQAMVLGAVYRYLSVSKVQFYLRFKEKLC